MDALKKLLVRGKERCDLIANHPGTFNADVTQ